MLKNSIAEALKINMDSLAKGPKAKYVVVGRTRESHFYGMRLRRVRKEIRRRHHDDVAADPRLQHVVVKMVDVTHVRLIDRSKYTGAKLRELRRKNGVGRPPRKEAAHG